MNSYFVASLKTLLSTCMIINCKGLFCRSAFCDAQLPIDLLREFLPRLIDVSCRNLYTTHNFVGKIGNPTCVDMW